MMRSTLKPNWRSLRGTAKQLVSSGLLGSGLVCSMAIGFATLTAEAAQPVSSLESRMAAPESEGLIAAVSGDLAPTAQPLMLQSSMPQPSISQPSTLMPAGLPMEIAQASVSGSNGTFSGQVLVRTSVQNAWNVLTDYNRFSSFLPSVEQSRVLQTNGNRKVFEQTNVIRVLGVTRRSRVVIASTETYPQQIAFRMVEGDVESLQGVWRIQPRGNNQVLITHQVTVDPGSSPTRGLFLTVYRNTLTNTLNALKREMERRGS